MAPRARPSAPNAAPARTASEAVAEKLRAQIATGALKPGDMLLSETALLEVFGVARPTMREALRLLESDGLVTVRRGVNGGARVEEPDMGALARRAGLHLQLRGADLHDLFAAQRVLQPGAVALAAEARTDADLLALRDGIEAVGCCEDLDSFADAATAFLDLVVHASGNETLALVSELISQLLHDELRSHLQAAVPPEEGVELVPWCVEQYARVVDLIEARDAAGAREFWDAHLAATRPDGAVPPHLLRVYQDV